MARAHGRTSAYVSRDIGAIWPWRWHVAQRCQRTGAMSRLNVGDGLRESWPAATRGASNTRARTITGGNEQQAVLKIRAIRRPPSDYLLCAVARGFTVT